MNAVLAALVSAVTSLTVALGSLALTARQKRRSDEQAEHQLLNSRYLHPLRLHLVENHLRLSQTLQRIDTDGGLCKDLLVIDDPAEISDKNPTWFNGPGRALVSSVYLTACLFAQMKKVRENFPHLRLPEADDTKLAPLLQVQRGFLRDNGASYLAQPNIGETMWVRNENRLLTYRQFCELLHRPNERVWLDPLIRFHLDTGRGTKTERARLAITAILELTDFLDDHVGRGQSIRRRWDTEGTELT